MHEGNICFKRLHVLHWHQGVHAYHSWIRGGKWRYGGGLGGGGAGGVDGRIRNFLVVPK